MNIQGIKVIDSEIIVITTTDSEVRWFEKKKLSGPQRTWFDNILSCSESLMNETSQK